MHRHQYIHTYMHTYGMYRYQYTMHTYTHTYTYCMHRLQYTYTFDMSVQIKHAHNLSAWRFFYVYTLVILPVFVTEFTRQPDTHTQLSQFNTF